MKKKQLYVVTGVCLLLVIAYIGGAVYFSNHFYPGTTIDGIEVGSMNLQTVKDLLHEQLSAKSLTVEECEFTETLKDLPLNMDLDQVDSLKEAAPYAWLFHLPKEHDYKIPVEVDGKQIKKMARSLKCFTDPRKENRAYLAFNGKEFEIIPEIYGTRVKSKKELYRAIRKACENLDDSVNLDKYFYQPWTKSDSKLLAKSLEYANSLMDLGIYYEFGSVKEELSNDKVADMIHFTKSGKASLDEDMVRAYIQSLEKSYDTSYTVRDFTTHNGNVIKIYDGDYGWWTNTQETVDQLMDMLKNKKGGKAEMVYRETAVNYPQDGPEYGDTYVEVSLSEQTLYLYKDGSCILSTPIVTGCVNKGRGTPRGMYPITYKERNHRMVGEDYDVDTYYWMPFNGNVGLHDATWRRSFGGSQYLNNGSHGCVNIPLWATQTIYNTVSKGTAVIVY